MRYRCHVRLLLAGVLIAATGCKQERPDPGPVAICSRQAPDICWSEAKAAADRQSDEALAKFEIACQAEEFKHRELACTWAGLGLQGQPDQKVRAIAMHEKGCELGVKTSCAHLASLVMSKAWSGNPQRPEAKEMFERVRSLAEPVCDSEPLSGEAAEFGNDPRAHACSTVAALYEHGFGTSKDPERAFEVWSRACEFGSPHGCAQRGFFYARGMGVEQDLSAAVEHYQQACDDGAAMGCANLASMYMTGKGVDRDYGRAAALYERACERNYLDSCTKTGLSGILAATDGDMEKRAAELMAHLDKEAAEIEAKLEEGDVADKEWVKQKLSTMFDVDQLYRKAFDYQKHLDEEQRKQFEQMLGKRVMEVDDRHLEEFKEIVEHWGWLTLSEFGPQTNDQAWLIVQHADRDVEFQERILGQFEKLRDEDEIKPSHYAYLYDRVAVNQDRKQLFGTQGRCVDGSWQPRPMEEPEKVDERRAKVGLQPMAEYKKMFEGKCP